MTDFLTRLAQRSMGAAPLIAPRLPSLFAPPEELNIGIADPATVIGTVKDTTIAPAPAPSRATAPAAPPHIEPRASVYPLQDTVTPEAAIEPRAAKRSEPRVEPEPTPLVQNIHANTPAAPQPAPAESPFAAPAEPRPEPRDQDRRAAPEPWLPLLPQRKTEPAAVLPAMADDRPAAQAALPAPTVHITIGRVEVRANIATPPVVPRPRATTTPALSLGDYLKRGAGAS